MKIVSDHGWPVASDGTDPGAFDAFKNEREYIAKNGKLATTVAAMDWAAREIELLQAALKAVRLELWVDYCLGMNRTDCDPTQFNARPHIRMIDGALNQK